MSQGIIHRPFRSLSISKEEGFTTGAKTSVSECTDYNRRSIVLIKDDSSLCSEFFKPFYEAVEEQCNRRNLNIFRYSVTTKDDVSLNEITDLFQREFLTSISSEISYTPVGIVACLESATLTAGFQKYFDCYFPEITFFEGVINSSFPSSTDDYRSGLPVPVFIGPDDTKLWGIEALLTEFGSKLDFRRETPYWSALKTYADNPAIGFHTLPTGQGRSDSTSIDDFVDYYGDAIFSSETSLSAKPLDSLSVPSGVILAAQYKAATAFGANKGPGTERHVGTRFVTSGTSTSNSIVISAIVKPDDYVLLDRNCHISNHHALANTYAKPVYIEPFHNGLGLSGPITLPSIKESLTTLLENKNRLPSLLILTNPTFDGIYSRPAEVVKAVIQVLTEYWENNSGSDAVAELISTMRFQPGSMLSPKNDSERKQFISAALKNIAFLFDEAWAALAYFHPTLIEYSSMHAAHELNNDIGELANSIRFYATQSAHKSLSAFRQASMIHYRDPMRARPEVKLWFETSFSKHTTTSPNASIIASLDIARRQAQLEGLSLISNSLRISLEFRELYKTDGEKANRSCFFVINHKRMMSQGENTLPHSDFYLDPRCITLSWREKVSGRLVREALLKQGIQINKYAENSVLLIFHLGIDSRAVTALQDVLDNLDLTKLTHQTDCTNPDYNALTQWRESYFNEASTGYWLNNLGGHTCKAIDLDDLIDFHREDNTNCISYVSAAFVTPYPPGYPLLIPGQVITYNNLIFLKKFSEGDIIGINRDHGKVVIYVYRVDD